MDRYLEMQTFVAVVDAGSFAGAADALGTSRAAVSRHVAQLEVRLGVRLLHRTTRRLSLTEEGEVFHARSRELLAGLEEAEAEISSRTGEAQGLLRLNVPVTFRRPAPGAALGRVSRPAPESPARHHACRPHADHAVIGYSYLASGDEWRFDGPQGPVSVKTEPCIRTNSGGVRRAAALAHQGVVLQPTFLVGEDLAAGRLEELMPEYRSPELGIYAVYPTRRHVPPKVRTLIDFLAERPQEP